MSSLVPMILQQKLMSSWQGRPIDERGIVRILNEDGSRSPLFWIFNSANEPESLAKVLGEDQPLVFSRSSHLIVQPHDDPTDVKNILTDYLVREIRRRFSSAHFDMGTSCQGSGMVMQLSNMLREVGIDVGHLCIINCSLPKINTNLPAFLVYGDEDEGHNPFQRDVLAAEERAKMIFSRYWKFMMKAHHGQYYSQGIIEEIITQFDRFRSSAHPERAFNAPASSSTVG